MKKITLKINNKRYEVHGGETILDVCQRNNIFIPTLCKHPDIEIQGKCRVCLVELNDGKIVTACSTAATDGLRVKTNSAGVVRARQVNLEMIYAEHIEKCGQCIREHSCSLKDYARKFGAKLGRYVDRKRDYPLWSFGAQSQAATKQKLAEVVKKCPASEREIRLKQAEIHSAGYIEFDASKCIDCGICSEVCRGKQSCDFYETVGAGYRTLTKPTDKLDRDCTYCGQCDIHCPVGAISGVAHWPAVAELLKTKSKHKKLLVAQIAPSIRVSIGEEFGLDYGQVVTGQIVAGLKKLGFDAVFDVSLGADFTTYEEARELIHWLARGKDRPMLTSCCPGWVKFVEFYYPEFVPHLTTTRSPQIISGLLAKTYWADLRKLNARDIMLVSVMPCTAKKQEIGLARHVLEPSWCGQRLNLADHEIAARCFIKNNEAANEFKYPAVDYVLTTREYAYLLKCAKIDLGKLASQPVDSPLGEHSGAGVIYGASGGVMESALRTADAFLRAKAEFSGFDPVLAGENLSKLKGMSKISRHRLEFKTVRGQKGIKAADVRLGAKKLKVAVASGLGNARQLLEAIKNRKVKYDYVEVMAGPGGCIGGGGQPVPTTAAIRAKRAAALYQIDKNLQIRTAHGNESLLKIYREYFQGDEAAIEQLLHCKYEDMGRRQGWQEQSNCPNCPN